jgi:hypothetical protein
MSDWTRHPDDPTAWIYRDRYTLRCELLTWNLYNADAPLAHIHARPGYYLHPEADTPFSWAESVVRAYEEMQTVEDAPEDAEVLAANVPTSQYAGREFPAGAELVISGSEEE